MWASSWASSASSCASGNAANAAGGNTMTGRSHPIITGTATDADSQTRTTPRTFKRAAIWAASAWSSSPTGLNVWLASRRATAQPPMNRSDNTMTPMAQMFRIQVVGTMMAVEAGSAAGGDTLIEANVCTPFEAALGLLTVACLGLARGASAAFRMARNVITGASNIATIVATPIAYRTVGTFVTRMRIAPTMASKAPCQMKWTSA